MEDLLWVYKILIVFSEYIETVFINEDVAKKVRFFNFKKREIFCADVGGDVQGFFGK